MAKKKNKSSKKLYRSGKERIIGGVCGGIAEYLNIDPIIVRLLWLLGAFLGIFTWGSTILLYIIVWLIMPRNPKHKW